MKYKVFVLGLIFGVLHSVSTRAQEYRYTLEQQFQNLSRETDPKKRQEILVEINQRIENTDERIFREVFNPPESRNGPAPLVPRDSNLSQQEVMDLMERRRTELLGGQVPSHILEDFFRQTQLDSPGGTVDVDREIIEAHLVGMLSQRRMSGENVDDAVSAYYRSLEIDRPSEGRNIMYGMGTSQSIQTLESNRYFSKIQELSSIMEEEDPYGFKESMADYQLWDELFKEGVISADLFKKIAEERRTTVEEIQGNVAQFNQTKNKSGAEAAFKEWEKNKLGKFAGSFKRGMDDAMDEIGKKEITEPCEEKDKTIRNNKVSKSKTEKLSEEVKKITIKLKDPHWKGDFNRDGYVNVEDLKMLEEGLSLVQLMAKYKKEHKEKEGDSEAWPDDYNPKDEAKKEWSEKASKIAFADLNHDGKFDEADIKAMNQLVLQYKKSKGIPADLDNNGKFNKKDIKKMEEWSWEIHPKQQKDVLIEEWQPRGEEYGLLMNGRKGSKFNPIEWPWDSVLQGPRHQKEKSSTKSKGEVILTEEEDPFF